MSDTPWTRVRKLGEGSFGTVELCRRGAEYRAIKRIRRCVNDEEGIPATVLREIAVLQHIGEHPNIVPLRYFLTGDQYNLLHFDAFESDFRAFLKQHAPLSESNAAHWMRQLLTATAWCHSHGVLHRDIKPANLLVKGERLVLADFGLGRCIDDFEGGHFTPVVVTLWYRCPELLLGCKVYGGAVDAWSVGAVFAELFRTSPLFQGDSEIAQLFQIFQLLGTPTTAETGMALEHFQSIFPKFKGTPCSEWTGTPASACSMLQGLLHLDPKARWTPEQALSDSFFTMHSVTSEVAGASKKMSLQEQPSSHALLAQEAQVSSS